LPEERKESVIVTKQIVVLIEAYQFANYIQNFIRHPAVKVNSMSR